MVKVDSNGRIELPQEIRDRLGITPGSEVDVREKDGKVVVEPADDPERIIHRMETLITESATENEDTSPIVGNPDPIAQKHRETVRRGVEQDSDL